MKRRLPVLRFDRMPRVRSDCLEGGYNAARPCPLSTCKHWLKHRVHSCALDVADLGGITLEEVGEIMGLTRERIRQIEEKALAKLKKKKILLQFRD